MANNEELKFVDEVSSELSKAPKKTKKSEPELVEYRALVDISYPGKKVLAGDVANDIPESSIGWLLEGNYIERVDN